MLLSRNTGNNNSNNNSTLTQVLGLYRPEHNGYGIKGTS